MNKWLAGIHSRLPGAVALLLGITSAPFAFALLSCTAAEPASSGPGDSSASISSQSTPSPAPGPSQSNQNLVVAFVNVNVVPMDTERVLADQTVIIRDGRIAEIGPAREIKVPSAVVSIDGRGKYLMPGLADTHVHFLPDRELNLALCQLYIANGVTTVLCMRGTPDYLKLRDDVAKGSVFGPTIYSVGPYVNEPFVRTPDEVEQAVVDQKRAGYDFIKLHGDLSREAYRRLFVSARREGIRVIGHAPRNLGLEAMFEERQYAVAHAEEYIYDRNNSSRDFAAIEPRIPELGRLTAAAGTWLMPNLTAFKNIGLQTNDIDAILRRPEMKFMPPPITESWTPPRNPYLQRFGKDHYPGIMARYALLEKLVRGFRAAGVRLLTGTDALNTAVVPGFSMHDELSDLVRAGLTPYEALRAATANPSEFFGAPNDAGTVSVGKRADLILAEGNPLTDVTNAARRAGVMVRGRWLSKTELQEMLDKLVASYAR